MKLLTIMSAAVLACQVPAFAAPPAAAEKGSRLSVGLGVVASSGVYAGEDSKTLPIPVVSYESERFFWRGIGGGIHLLEQDGLSLDATLTPRFDGIKPKDFGATELAQRGVDRAKLEERDHGLDLGLAAGWRGGLGELRVGIKADVTGASKGFEGNLKYAYPFQLGATRITPHVSVALLSKKLANYYYGTLSGEVARGVVDYKPGNATVPGVGIDGMRVLSDRWIMLGSVSYKVLPSKISDSPLVKAGKDGDASLFVGVARSF